MVETSFFVFSELFRSKVESRPFRPKAVILNTFFFPKSFLRDCLWTVAFFNLLESTADCNDSQENRIACERFVIFPF